MYEQCKCGTPLMFESECDLGLCYDCQDAAIAKYQRVAEWAEFHDGEYYDEESQS